MIENHEENWFHQLPLLNFVHQEEITLDQPFEHLASGFAKDPGTMVLLSGSSLDCSRYHILAADPWLEIRSWQDRVVINVNQKSIELRTDVFDVIETLTQHFGFKDLQGDLPVTSGLFGYLGYDLKDRIEALPVTCTGMNLPDLFLCIPSFILVHDRKSDKSILCLPDLVDANGSLSQVRSPEQVRTAFFDRFHIPFEKKSFTSGSQSFKSSLTKSEYIRAVERIIRYLKAGDIYQANFSQRFESGFSGDSYSLFLDLFKRNPASFFSYINAGDHTIVSTSPERFIKQTGRKIETRPIKGTIARSPDKKQDKENKKILATSLKDDAELTMIVDLMRNDLSRVTTQDTVVVTEHKRLEPYENVHHLVSIVEGQLKPGKTSVDLIRATFPGGSITGCPKIRAMEIIDELEPVKRHVYTGSIGYVSFHDSMDLSIAIRTATIVDERIVFSVGGGIVYDSDPEKEYQETLDKGKTLLDSLNHHRTIAKVSEPKAWANGKICPAKEIKVPALSQGFQYGEGIFETIRVSRGRIFFLNDHITRMNRAWHDLFGLSAPDITWGHVIRHLIRENNYQQKDLAVKIILCRDRDGIGKNGTDNSFMAVIANAYVHRLEGLNKNGLDLVTYPHRRHHILARYKTMNYLFYEQAKRYALEKGGDEALILNTDHTVSETNTANIIGIDHRKVIVPDSAYALGGITLKKVLDLMADKGYEIIRQPVQRDRICTVPNLMVTNSLMGAVKVLSIDGKKTDHDTDYCDMINSNLFKY